MCDGTEPIEDDELLYRRIPLQPDYYNPSISSEPSYLAFRPWAHDVTGISVYRDKYFTPEEVARMGRGQRYHIAVLRAGHLRACGLDVVPSPTPDEPGHAEIPALAYANAKTDRASELMVLLAQKLCIDILGPLP